MAGWQERDRGTHCCNKSTGLGGAPAGSVKVLIEFDISEILQLLMML